MNFRDYVYVREGRDRAKRSATLMATKQRKMAEAFRELPAKEQAKWRVVFDKLWEEGIINFAAGGDDDSNDWIAIVIRNALAK